MACGVGLFARHLWGRSAFTLLDARGVEHARTRGPTPGSGANRRRAILIHALAKESVEATEVFITIIPRRPRPPREQAHRVFSAVADVLRRQDARIIQERVFAAEGAMKTMLPLRTPAYGDLDDGVPPVTLAVPEGPAGAMAGVQVHAVRARETPRVVRLENCACGRALKTTGHDYVALSGLTAPEAGAATAQARAVFEKAESALGQVGGTMLSVARTWLWLGDILDWYGDFNRVRNQFFAERGLLNGSPEQRRLPASTGIGVRPAGGPRCALDVIAIIGAGTPIEYFDAAGKQQCAYEYGSAFSRTARAATPAGKTVYVSGTAAIDTEGRTQHVGDARAQIEMTLTNVRAALRDMGCGDGDVVQAFVYSKSPDVEAVFRREWADLAWPCVSVLSDVCRDDLLFEVEATACPGARQV